MRNGRLLAWCTLGGSAIVGLGAAATAWAAAGDAHPRPGPVLFGLAVLVVAAKLGGLVAERWGQPSVLGELLVVQPNVSRLVVGVAMIPRGEVGLIFAGIGASLTLHGQPILAQSAFSAIVVMVVITTLVTPIGLQWAFRRTTRRAKGTPR